MKADERVLEKLVKRIVRGQSVDTSSLEFHWRGFGKAADLMIIRILNRAGGWEMFARWIADQPSIHELGQALSQTPGISKSGMETFEQRGLLHVSETNQAQQALSIVSQIESGPQDESQKLLGLLQSDVSLLDGVLLLLETSTSESSARFLDSLLEQGFSKDQETRIRKLLYHFRQKGIRPEVEVAQKTIERELFFFGENMLPLWQPVLYFRPHSVFSAAGDLLVLRIQEGNECAPQEQQRNLVLNHDSLQQIAERYSAQLEQQLGIRIQFHRIDSVHARYLLGRSVEMIEESAASLPLQEFLRFIGSDPSESPFESLPEARPDAFVDADFLSREPYFAHWTVNPNDIEEYLQQLAALEKGPIILTGGALSSKKEEIGTSIFQKVFSMSQRLLWSYAFQKAAFYLRNSNPAVSVAAIYWAKQLENQELSAENIEIARALFHRTAEFVQAQLKAKQEEERKTSLIVTPDEFRKKQ